MYPYKSSHVDYFQIGAHVGNSFNDPLFSVPVSGKSIILVEPVPFLYRLLKHNYRDKIRDNEIEFLNIAVSNRDGTIDMVVPAESNDFDKFPFFLNQLASTTDKYIKRFNFAQRFPEFKFDTTSVPCRTLNTICRERGVTSIGHLIVDTEGHDETILRDLDFTVLKPQKITFENCYMEDGETSDALVDRSRYQAFRDMLISVGYRVVHEDHEDTTVEFTGL